MKIPAVDEPPPWCGSGKNGLPPPPSPGDGVEGSGRASVNTLRL